MQKGWWVANFVLTPKLLHACLAADRLRVGTPVSIGAHSHAHDEPLAQNGVLRHTDVELDELSILRADQFAAYPGARVVGIWEPQAGRDRTAEPAGKTFYGGPVIRRPGIGQVLGVR